MFRKLQWLNEWLKRRMCCYENYTVMLNLALLQYSIRYDVTVTDIILWRGHHDRVVMRLNWLYFCGICQMIPLIVWPNTALGCNHQSICMPQLQLFCSAALVSNVLPEGMKARVSSVQWSRGVGRLKKVRGQDFMICLFRYTKFVFEAGYSSRISVQRDFCYTQGGCHQISIPAHHG